MKKLLFTALVAFAVGFVFGNKPNMKSKRAMPATFTLSVGDSVDLSTNGLEDGKNYLRRLVVAKTIGMDNKPIATGDKLEERQQEWTILTGTGNDRHGIVLVNQR